MKRFVSLILSLVIMLTMLSFQSTAYSAGNITAAQKLEQIQTKSGFIPGKTAAITGNCYAFISKVCEELYGVSYNGEGLYNSYQCSHSTGNYYTASTFTTSNTTLSANSNDVERIINFFTSYATVGDIVHYGSLTGSTTHTFMVQSVDSEKLRFYHSNYGDDNCNIDTIYWDSFRQSPTANKTTSNGLSRNSLFYNKMKQGGLGITINRFSNYSSIYPVVAAIVPTISGTRKSPTSIKLSWNAVSGATKYHLQYKTSDSNDKNYQTINCTDTSFTVTDLTLGGSYDFRVRAYSNGSWNDYSDKLTMTALPPTISSVEFTNKSSGIKMSWAKRTDIDGVRIYRSTSKSGKYDLIADLTENGVDSFLDTNVVGNTTYYYKFSRYIIQNETEYSTLSSAKSVECTMTVLTEPTNLTATNSSLTAITISWKAVAKAKYYVVEYKKDGGNWEIYGTTKSCSKKITALEAGVKYSFRVKASNDIVESPYSKTVTKKTNVKTPAKPKASYTSKGIKLKWSKISGAGGYKVYRANSKNGKYKLVKTIKKGSTKTWTDKSVTKNKGYYYKIVAFQKKDGKTYISDKSSAVFKRYKK